MNSFQSAIEFAYKIAKHRSDDFHSRLDAECGRVLEKAGISGKITRKKLLKLGYAVVYTPDGAARICKNGVPVSDIIYPLPV